MKIWNISKVEQKLFEAGVGHTVAAGASVEVSDAAAVDLVRCFPTLYSATEPRPAEAKTTRQK